MNRPRCFRSALIHNFLEGLAGFREKGSFFDCFLIPAQDHVAIERIAFDEAGPPPWFLRCN